MKVRYDTREASTEREEEKRDWIFDCPVCEEPDHLVVTWKRAQGRYFLFCRSASCQGLGGDYLREVALAVGAPGGSGWALAEDPLQWLDTEPGNGRSLPRARRPRGDAPFVSEGKVYEWHRRLMESSDVLAYLKRKRGLSIETIEAHVLGYDDRAITVPVWLDHDFGLISNVKRRYWPGALTVNGEPVWKMGMKDARAQLYPDVPTGRAWLLCEGELDALLARQHGLPAVTSTTGTSWSPEWDAFVRGRRVAVVYDAGEASAKLAERRAAGLLAAGAAEAWPVRLPLPDGEDITDWFVKYGRTASELRELIKDARR